MGSHFRRIRLPESSDSRSNLRFDGGPTIHLPSPVSVGIRRQCTRDTVRIHQADEPAMFAQSDIAGQQTWLRQRGIISSTLTQSRRTADRRGQGLPGQSRCPLVDGIR